ncbi:hypothetical protein LXL04_015897 [Taraxacum kok-saghyz]
MHIKTAPNGLRFGLVLKPHQTAPCTPLIDIMYHFLKDNVQKKIADVFTKALDEKDFSHFLKLLRMLNPDQSLLKQVNYKLIMETNLIGDNIASTHQWKIELCGYNVKYMARSGRRVAALKAQVENLVSLLMAET